MTSEPDWNILFLGPDDSPLLVWLKKTETSVIHTASPITSDFIDRHQISFVISYNYRHIIKKDVLSKIKNRAINLHISYLPWNRGAHPNLWSFIDHTPKGVSIHLIDDGIDTGDIVAQKRIEFEDLENETLTTTYNKLHDQIQKLFIETWPDIKTQNYNRLKQKEKGTFHQVKDLRQIEHFLVDGWNTSVKNITNLQLTADSRKLKAP